MKYGKPDVLILNTNSRLDDRETAYQKVRQTTRRLQARGCRLFFNKTCSVFRGNIGAEFDAMLDELGEEFAVVVLGFPKNGRITREGIHYVWGVPLAESEFRCDPMHPMRESNLVKILGSQTRRKVGLIDYRVVDAGPAALSRALEESRAKYNYVILDVTGQDSLVSIAQAVQDKYVLCGSSALGKNCRPCWARPRRLKGTCPCRGTMGWEFCVPWEASCPKAGSSSPAPSHRFGSLRTGYHTPFSGGEPRGRLRPPD